MNAYKVTGNTIVKSTDGQEIIVTPFYIADDDGMIVVISEDMSTNLNECGATIVSYDSDDFHDFYDMRAELEYQEEYADACNIVDIIATEDGRYEIV